MDIAVTDVVDPELRDEILDRLYEHNVEQTGIDDGRELAVVVCDDDGARLGSLIGWTWGGALLVELLFVEPAHRNDGIGSLLLAAAEAEARSRGCELATVGTHSFQAPGFYARHGYRELARLDGNPRGHAEVWMAKALRTPADGTRQTGSRRPRRLGRGSAAPAAAGAPSRARA